MSRRIVIRASISAACLDTLPAAVDAQSWAGVAAESSHHACLGWTATHEHKVIWAVSTLLSRDLARLQRPDLYDDTEAAAQTLWELGSLQVTTSAPKYRAGRWTIMCKPPLIGLIPATQFAS